MLQSIEMTVGSLASPSWSSSPIGSGASSRANAPAGSFADQLDASFQARAKRLGLDLPQPPPSPGASTDGVEDTWDRVQREDSAIHGVADAIMQSLADAADARYERRQHRGTDLFGL